ncbi:MAG: threonylcarbamoyl-AMP synthase [Elusimicrobia bacterium]|nr:threonylcarbamoyl-AMP synthase [Elusimicrobiota bacterium]
MTRPEKKAAQALQRGELIIFPTETVYALAADGLSKKAKQKIYSLKARDSRKPLGLLLADGRRLRRYVDPKNLTPKVRRLLRRFWPGPLTVIFPASDLGAAIAGGPTIGIRVPDHPVAAQILKNAGVPVVATSANKSGGPEPVRGEDIPISVKNAAKCVVMEKHKSAHGAPSTVVDISVDPPKILREGAIAKKEIEKWLK